MTIAPRLFPGATIACLATGPSLTQADCDWLRDHAIPAVAVNDAYRLAPWAQVLYSSDRQWWPFYKGVPAFQGLKFGIGSGMGKDNGFRHYPEIQCLRNTGYDGLELNPAGLKNGRNSGYAAVNLAVHLGAARILLLGYNLCRLPGKTHFFGDHPSALSQNPSLYPSFARTFATLVKPLREIGVEIVNCTPETALTCFPRLPLEQALCGTCRSVA
jgi:hypothetical protein